ncbi:MAG: DUF4199 domain-containing protein [Duncaniella sp.]|nr:DUF4199 domain-containing protein [Duncaniella sp.]
MIQSPYRRGADDGIVMGLYLTVMFFASIFSGSLPVLTWLAFLMIVCVPLLVWRLMGRYHRALGQASSFAMLWMYGVVMFFCGMLISGVALEVYMTWIHPGYVAEQLQALAALQGDFPDTYLDSMASMAQSMLDAHFIPAPINLVAELVMMAIVSGSVLSIVLGALLTFRSRRRPVAM